MKKMFCCFALVCLSLAFYVSNLGAYPLMYFWLYNSEGMVDENGKLLPEGARVEFIWAGADGMIDDPILDLASPDFLRPGGDDVIVVDKFLNEIVFAVGDGLDKNWTPADQYYGHIDVWVNGLQANLYTAHGADSNEPWDDKFYMRFFSAENPQQTFFEFGYVSWGESELLLLPSFPPLDPVELIYEDLDFYTGQPLITNMMIPEPATLFTGLVSLILVIIRKKK
ncbi:MAG: hypothetical protein RBU23_11550 [Candidatus Auribacterota bacterium]|jgi:hypothetical protein|nr:hypothetical protein [Candidatus Auribacterota bacterium]